MYHARILSLAVSLTLAATLSLAPHPAFASVLEHACASGLVVVAGSADDADFVVFVEESAAYADVLVFPAPSPYVENPGVWFFENDLLEADYRVHITDNRDLADFTIHYVESEYEAGCGY